MPSNTSIDLTIVVIVTLLYGMYFVVTATSLALQWSRPIPLPHSPSRRRSTMLLNDPMFIGALILLAIITAHWICVVLRLFSGSGHNTDTLHTVTIALMLATLVEGSAMLIYRLWCVRRSVSVVIPPILGLGGLISCGIGLVQHIARFKDISTSEIWATTTIICGLATVVYCSSILAWLIYNTSRKSRPFRADRTSLPREILDIFIPCGAIFSSWFTAYTVTYLAKSSASGFLADTLVPVTGMSFAINKAMTYIDRAVHRAARARSPSLIFEARPGPQQSDNEFGHPMNPISIHVAEVSGTNSDIDVNSIEDRTAVQKTLKPL